MMRYARLSPDDSVVIGRNPAFAGLAVYHREVSRSHTRVWASDGTVFVQDLRSTNGTIHNGKPVGTDASQTMSVGDVIGLGPVRLRLEWGDTPHLTRLQRVADLIDSSSERRDPLTHLLKPQFLVDRLHSDIAQLPHETDQIGLVLLSIDRISQLHAQHGQAVADTAFHNVAMLALYNLAHPHLAARAGYGEVLLAIPGPDRDEMVSIASDLIKECTEQVFLESGHLSLTAAAGIRETPHDVDAWIQLLRRALQQRSPSQSDSSRVFTV